MYNTVFLKERNPDALNPLLCCKYFSLFQLLDASKGIGLEINTDKTKYMIVPSMKGIRIVNITKKI
jgi:hypothetical protein